MNKNGLIGVPNMDDIARYERPQDLSPGDAALWDEFSRAMTLHQAQHIDGPRRDETIAHGKLEERFRGDLDAALRVLRESSETHDVLAKVLNRPETALAIAETRVFMDEAAKALDAQSTAFDALAPEAFTVRNGAIGTHSDGLELVGAITGNIAAWLRRSSGELHRINPPLARAQLNAAAGVPGALISGSEVRLTAMQLGEMDRALQIRKLEIAVQDYLDKLAPYFGVRAYARTNMSAARLEKLAEILKMTKKHVDAYEEEREDPKRLGVLQQTLLYVKAELKRLKLHLVEFQGAQIDLFLEDIDPKQQKRLIAAKKAELEREKAEFRGTGKLVKVFKSIKHPDGDGSRGRKNERDGIIARRLAEIIRELKKG